MLKRLVVLGLVMLSLSCASKKEILYFQDIDRQNDTKVVFTETLIQPNDMLRIDVVALSPEAAEPYNLQNNNQAGGGGGGQMMQLQGYLVAPDYTITFPILGRISVKNKTTRQLEDDLTQRLEATNQLVAPTVNVRLLNAKFTVLGEVANPGTHTFMEQNVTLFQALGIAGGLTINGVREDVVIMRMEEGVKQVTHIDLTKTDYMDGPFAFIRPNDLIIVNPNGPAVKRAGYITSPSALIGIISGAIALTVLLTR